MDLITSFQCNEVNEEIIVLFKFAIKYERSIGSVKFFITCILIWRFKMSHYESILITGGASGLGLGVAKHYSKNKNAHIFLIDINPSNLENAKKVCEEFGATIHTKIANVMDEEAMETVIYECDGIRPLDLIVANAAGQRPGSTSRTEDIPEDIMWATKICVNGVANTVFPALGLMKSRGKGHIVMTSSAASFVGLWGLPGYAAAKMWVRRLAEMLPTSYPELTFTAIAPGAVKTPLWIASNIDPNTGELKAGGQKLHPLSVEEGVEYYIKGIESKEIFYAFPPQLSEQLSLAEKLPYEEKMNLIKSFAN